MSITRDEAKKLIHDTNGRMFGATFTKKDGTKRDMNCRVGVKKHLSGGERAYNPDDYDLVFVYDMHKKGYRSIPIDRLHELRVDGQKLSVEA